MIQSRNNNRRLNYFAVIILSILAILLIIVLVSYIYSYFVEEKNIDSNTFQAVFLANDQIYFGHISDINSNFVELSDVYYVKVGSSDSVGNLVKLGDTEPHGPENEMIINRDFILFWENLNPSSPVIQKIRNLEIL